MQEAAVSALGHLALGDPDNPILRSRLTTALLTLSKLKHAEVHFCVGLALTRVVCAGKQKFINDDKKNHINLYQNDSKLFSERICIQQIPAPQSLSASGISGSSSSSGGSEEEKDEKKRETESLNIDKIVMTEVLEKICQFINSGSKLQRVSASSWLLTLGVCVCVLSAVLYILRFLFLLAL